MGITLSFLPLEQTVNICALRCPLCYPNPSCLMYLGKLISCMCLLRSLLFPIIVLGKFALHSLVPHVTSFLGQHLSFHGNSDISLYSKSLYFNFPLNIIPPQLAFFIRVFLSSSISAIPKYSLSSLASFPTGHWLSFGHSLLYHCCSEYFSGHHCVVPSPRYPHQ